MAGDNQIESKPLIPDTKTSQAFSFQTEPPQEQDVQLAQVESDLKQEHPNWTFYNPQQGFLRVQNEDGKYNFFKKDGKPLSETWLLDAEDFKEDDNGQIIAVFWKPNENESLTWEERYLIDSRGNLTRCLLDPNSSYFIRNIKRKDIQENQQQPEVPEPEGKIKDINNSNQETSISLPEGFSKLPRKEQYRMRLIRYLNEITHTFDEDDKKTIIEKFKTDSKEFDHLHKKGQPNSLFFDELFNVIDGFPGWVVKDTNIKNILSHITPEIIDSFPTKDKKLWTSISKIKEPSSKIINFLLLNKKQINDFFNEKGEMTLKLFNSLLTSKLTSNLWTNRMFTMSTVIMDFIGANVTQEIISSFSLDQQKLLKGLKNLKKIDIKIFNIISAEKNQLSLFFDKNDYPTSKLFEFLLDSINKDYGIYISLDDHIINNLTPETLASFSPNEQKLWKGIKNTKNLNMRRAYLILKNKDKIDSFFDENNQPTSELFGLLLDWKPDNISDEKNPFSGSNHYIPAISIDFIKANLTQKIRSSSSPNQQKLLDIVINLNDKDTDIFNFILENRDKLDLFFDENNQPTLRLLTLLSNRNHNH
jgi:hypothetical protein